MRPWNTNLLRLVFISAVLFGAAFFAFAQRLRPTDRLYALLAQAAQSGWNAELRREAGSLYIELGDLDAALAHWESALLISPADELLLRRTAELYVQRARWPEALAAVRRLLEARPDDAWANLHLGLILAPSAPVEAAAALRRAAQAGMQPPDRLIETLEAERESPRGLALEVGTVMADAKIYSYAERAFELAATLGFARGEALASVALMRGLQSKDGQRWLDEAMATAPQSPQVHAAAGYYYRATGQSFLSLASFANAISFAPLDAKLYAELGRSYELIGDPATAAFWYGQAAMIAPNVPKYAQMAQAAAAMSSP